MAAAPDGDAAARAQCVKELAGQVVRLATHSTGASILELVFNGHQGHAVATRAQKDTLFRECYGREFMVFSKKNATLGEFLAQDSEKKESVLSDLCKLLEKIISKGFHRFGFAHWLLAEYFEHCGEARQRAMAPSLTEATLELASTTHGVTVLCACVDVSPAKDRKKIVKWFRGNALKISMHMTGHRVLMRLLDVVDDTVLTRKAIVNEMAEQCHAMAQDKYGVRVLLHLLAPHKVQYLGDEDAGLLSRAITNSKKDPEVRRGETLKTLRQPLIDMCVQQCASLLVAEGGAGCWLVLEVMRKWRSETLAIALAELLGAGLDAPESNDMDVDDDDEEDVDNDDDDDENLALLERFHVQMLTKTLIDMEESQDEEEDGESKFIFTTAFWSAISERALEMATKNRTAYVIESLLKGSAVADRVRDKLQSGEEALEGAMSSREGGSESILSVIKLMAFSDGKKSKKKAKAKSAPSKSSAKPKKSTSKASKRAKKPVAEDIEEEEEQPKSLRRSARATTRTKKNQAEKPALRRSTRTRKGSI